MREFHSVDPHIPHSMTVPVFIAYAYGQVRGMIGRSKPASHYEPP
jgi:hypothetical protein